MTMTEVRPALVRGSGPCGPAHLLTVQCFNKGKFPIWDFLEGSYSMLAVEAQNIPIWVDSDISDAYIV